MARIESDPNYTTPTFSRATAATDLFKKEDVQNLAAAVSTHDHASGKGALITGPINGSQIVDGSITSAKIANETITSANILNGTIVTADIANGATTSSVIAGAFLSPSTTSTGAVAIPGLTTPSLSCVGGRTVLVHTTTTVQSSAVSQNCNLFLLRDAVSIGCMMIGSATAVGQILALTFTYYDSVTPGGHTWGLGWSTNTGTLQMIGAAFSAISVTELRA